MINFNEDNLTIDTNLTLLLAYEPVSGTKLVINKLYTGGLEYIKPVFNEISIVTTNLRDDEGDIGSLMEFTKEVREFDMILPSGIGNDVPRRHPTELSYKAKRMKNSFK